MMNKNRHSIRLKNFDYSTSGYYFVTICTKNRECLFGKIVNYNVKHYILHIISGGSPNINIWQRNYYEHIIRNENELLKIRQNIKTNPLHWKDDINNPQI